MTIREMVGKLSRDELLQLIDDRWLLWQVTKNDVLFARIKCLQRQAEKAFAEWQAFKLPETSSAKMSGYYLALEKKEKIFKRYDRISKKISKLFDIIHKDRNNHAADSPAK